MGKSVTKQGISMYIIFIFQFPCKNVACLEIFLFYFYIFLIFMRFFIEDKNFVLSLQKH